MTYTQMRQLINALEPIPTQQDDWNSEKLINNFNRLLASSGVDGPFEQMWQERPCICWYKDLRQMPQLRVWFCLCKQDYSVDVSVCITAGSGDNELILFEKIENVPATFAALSFVGEQFIKHFQQRVNAAQQLVAEIKEK